MKQNHFHLPTHIFIRKLTRNLLMGFFLIVIVLIIGMCGYHHFEKMNWVDAYANAAMILSGMGPIGPLHSDAGKIFAGSYAIFCGAVFLVIIAIVFAPLVHRFFHKWHLEDPKN